LIALADVTKEYIFECRLAPLEPVRPPEFGGPTSPFLFTPLGERELFLTRTDTETPLWVSDGTAPGTLDLTPAFGGATAPFEEDLLLGGTFAVPRFAVVDSRAFFAADDAVHGSELWMTDGTVAGTALVSDIVNGPYPSSPRELVRFGSHVYFVAESHGKGRELWRTDGTEAGTELVADLVKGAGSSLPENLYAAGSELYFSAWTPARGREAWRIRLDGSPSPQPVPLDEIAPGAFSSSPQIFREIGGTVFTVANDNLHGFELWTLREPDVVFADGFEGTTAALWSSAP
jgi:ELWxxDGT repeat protein